MVGKFLSKLFGLNNRKEKESTIDGKQSADPVGLVRFLVLNLVTKQDQISIESSENNQEVEIFIRCDKSDMGRVIGKQGKTISAIRQLAGDAAARIHKKIRKIEVIEP